MGISRYPAHAHVQDCAALPTGPWPGGTQHDEPADASLAARHFNYGVAGGPDDVSIFTRAWLGKL